METTHMSVGSPRRLPSTDIMKTPDDIAAMLRLHALGWGVRRIARELCISPNTVRSYVRAGGWRPFCTPDRPGALDAHAEWLRERFLRHRGNAVVVQEELRRERGVDVSLRTVERAVAPFRDELRAEALATVRFETPPGHQLQLDFGERLVDIAGARVRAHFLVATLGYSRRIFTAAYACERQAQWFDGLEAAFLHFGGVPAEVLCDNARALVAHHNPSTREVTFNETFRRFCQHWGTRPRACAPYRARTKGKDERAVQYVARNALAGRAFPSWEDLNAHLVRWTRETADVRVHGTTGQRPIDRFLQAERHALQPLRPVGFHRRRELFRRVQADGCVEVDTNQYSVPWLHIRKRVVVHIFDGKLLVFRDGGLIASHEARPPSRARVLDPAHATGLVRPPDKAPASSDLQRPLAAYEAVIGGPL